MNDYPEIAKLRSFLDGRKVRFKKLKKDDPYFFPVQLKINQHQWKIYIDDEYEDFNSAKPLSCLYLILLALDTYEYAEDYLDWCNQYNLDAANMKWLDYFKELDKIYHEIEDVLGEIDPCISDYDYTLRTGVVDELLK
ncbi:hypothetical protein [Parvicella tangerina]|uniref:Uncharacterized protein n=1 Tax=Parvicella tangerina TaxID=2829795 RepID=A0A916JME7_9FLAO|nr:hypothetical protein [Parvicella tangerina]CAG5081563.1 hypothetical protein CRYO30217_01669 [Parvicella tangerina]